MSERRSDYLTTFPSEAGNLNAADRKRLQDFLASTNDFPVELRYWLIDFFMQEVVHLIPAIQIQGRTRGAAPSSSSFVTVSAEDELSAERVLTAGTGVSIVDGGSTVTISATGTMTTELVIAIGG